MILLKIIVTIIWAMVCLPLAVVLFYVMESIELAKIFSSYIEKVLRD